jgi:hypothetical protein
MLIQSKKNHLTNSKAVNSLEQEKRSYQGSRMNGCFLILYILKSF